MYYPLMIEMKDKNVYIIGGGKVAIRKARKFLEYGAKVIVISPEFIEEFYTLKTSVGKNLSIISENYNKELVKNAFLVIGATNIDKVNQEIAMFCKGNNIMCNIVDSMELSDFIVPSTIKRGDLEIAISTLGNSPSLCAKIRKELEEKYDDTFDEYVKLLGEGRALVLEKYVDEKKKKDILNSMVQMTKEELEEYIKFLKL
ncbi:bifunctional precorrin-2 dehydrogenase/sirohydrochlorin ferrochelatase [Hathewaya histolytica]|uniref:precorrin-2 dehydrogenase n=1 Tax=Hathewaya histolytica TaxID=1498 RepID=A0A4V6KCB0_HATHI|nr:bifunctional precorrin-2 dehydrogenase/sirohydrochlorin ferrochelatase [Hathewaya histolytica]VTQ84597.1 siroheme synthase [Hathewaya histolytica]